MEITVKETTMVRPAGATPGTSLWLSSLDLLMPERCHTCTLYVYTSNGGANLLNSSVLKAALGRAMLYFYPVAGRLKKTQNNRMEIDCSGEGALFVEAEADGVIDDLGDFDPKPQLIHLVPKVDYSRGISNCPLLLVQLTRFKCGGVCMGIALDHHLTDGVSAIHFINTWSDIARGLDIAIPPFLDRKAVLHPRNPPQPQFPHGDYRTPPTMKTPRQADAIIFRRFKLTRDQINALKAKCTENGIDVGDSTYEVVAGHAWRCVTIARKLPFDQETKLTVVVDGRSRLQPPLPKGYFGNVAFGANPTVLAGELQLNPVEFSIRKVHEEIARMDNDYLRSAIDYLELQPDFTAFSRSIHAYGCPNLLVASWGRLPFYNADFGWGKPIYVGPWEIPSEGTSHVLPTEDGSALYAISLPKEQMCLFEKLFYDI